MIVGTVLDLLVVSVSTLLNSKKSGELKSADEQVIGDAITIYASFIAKPGKI